MRFRCRTNSNERAKTNSLQCKVVTKGTYISSYNHNLSTITRSNTTSNSYTTTSGTNANTTFPTLAPSISIPANSILSETQRDARMLQQLAQQQRGSNISIPGVGSPVHLILDQLTSDTITPSVDNSGIGERNSQVVRSKLLETIMIMVSYQLVSKCGWIALNFNSFISRSPGLFHQRPDLISHIYSLC